MEQVINIQPAWAYVVFGVLFCISICRIFKAKKPIEIEAPLPDESEVIGKDLPVGFRFMKDGKVVEVVKEIQGCNWCVYKHPDCATGIPLLCCKHHRVKNDSIVFKYVE